MCMHNSCVLSKETVLVMKEERCLTAHVGSPASWLPVRLVRQLGKKKGKDVPEAKRVTVIRLSETYTFTL